MRATSAGGPSNSDNPVRPRSLINAGRDRCSADRRSFSLAPHRGRVSSRPRVRLGLGRATSSSGRGGPSGSLRTQGELEEVELESQEAQVRGPRPRRPTPPPPPPSGSRPNSAVDVVAARSVSPGAVWDYPKQRVDDKGQRSPLMLFSDPAKIAHEESSGAERRMSTSTVRGVARKSGFTSVGPRALQPQATGNRSVLSRGHDQDYGLDIGRN
ncbi:hypothetical protein V8D89_002243 [Ganoderma adspersum]